MGGTIYAATPPFRHFFLDAPLTLTREPALMGTAIAEPSRWELLMDQPVDLDALKRRIHRGELHAPVTTFDQDGEPISTTGTTEMPTEVVRSMIAELEECRNRTASSRVK